MADNLAPASAEASALVDPTLFSSLFVSSVRNGAEAACRETCRVFKEGAMGASRWTMHRQSTEGLGGDWCNAEVRTLRDGIRTELETKERAHDLCPAS